MSANAPLRPVWGKALGLKSFTGAVENDRRTASDEGWQPVGAISARPGGPIAIKKKLGPHLWISTTVRPGDPRYPSAQQP